MSRYSTAMALPRTFYARDALSVARDLLGMHLIIRHTTGLRVGRIVETEAYQGPDDLAAHSAGGRRTARTEVMYGPAGHAYVYLIYGIWNCLNVVAGTPGVPHAVLLRALEPVAGIDQPSWGPGLLCRALGIDRRYNGRDLRGRKLWIQKPRTAASLRIATATRIGVDYAGDWAQRPWRFFDRDSAFVSTVTAAARRRATAAGGRLQIQV
ncbi:MAG TPA: DNA-3-methyladenine glycosylase [Steroidobacteraceae bacterium]|nr:DNA-3-methyladenine glycosylase [Steroidobacteraceae bacterium]